MIGSVGLPPCRSTGGWRGGGVDESGLRVVEHFLYRPAVPVPVPSPEVLEGRTFAHDRNHVVTPAFDLVGLRPTPAPLSPEPAWPALGSAGIASSAAMRPPAPSRRSPGPPPR